jgi:hypothetical protein
MGRTILLFAPMRADDGSFWFLGPATYVRHEGERHGHHLEAALPCPLPGDLYQEFAAALV